MARKTVLDDYLNDIKSLPKSISAEEELRLIREAKSGDIVAQEKFLSSYLWQVVIEARKRFYGQELPDLVQLGNLGLMYALKKYDLSKINPQTSKPYRFLTYASRWIALFMGRGWEKMIKSSMGSLNVPIFDKGGDELIVELESKSNTILEVSRNDLSTEVDKLLDKLDERERDIIKRLFGIGHSCTYTLREIALVHSITYQRVHQIRNIALEKLEAIVKDDRKNNFQ